MLVGTPAFSLANVSSTTVVQDIRNIERVHVEFMRWNHDVSLYLYNGDFPNDIYISKSSGEKWRKNKKIAM
jgi:hypothetical protein